MVRRPTWRPEETSCDPAAGRATSSDPAPARPRVLVVERSPARRRRLSEAVRRAGAEPLEAATPLDAVDALVHDPGGVDAAAIARELTQTGGDELAGFLAETYPELLVAVVPGPEPSGPIRRLVRASTPPPARTVLLVDDDDACRRDLEDELRGEGLDVVSAANGVEALTILASRRVDLIVLDLVMPGMSGWELLEQRAADARIADTPVIVVSAAHDLAPPARVAAALPKPLERRTLRAAVAAHLRAP